MTQSRKRSTAQVGVEPGSDNVEVDALTSWSARRCDFKGQCFIFFLPN